LDPVWHAFVSFGVLPRSTDALHVEVWDDDALSADDCVGVACAPALTFDRLRHAGVPV
jgi:hypothetical protein